MTKERTELIKNYRNRVKAANKELPKKEAFKDNKRKYEDDDEGYDDEKENQNEAKQLKLT